MVRQRYTSGGLVQGLGSVDHGFPVTRVFGGRRYRLRTVFLGSCSNSMTRTAKPCGCGTKTGAVSEAARLRDEGFRVRVVDRKNKASQRAGTALYVRKA